MTCPHCGSETKVINSRPQEDSVYRRRECLMCKERFSTTEIDIEMYQKITKSMEVKNENKNFEN
jgi:transcriptional regulator NrdR family protein